MEATLLSPGQELERAFHENRPTNPPSVRAGYYRRLALKRAGDPEEVERLHEKSFRTSQLPQ